MKFNVTHRNKKGVLINAFNFDAKQAARWVNRYRNAHRIVLALHCGTTDHEWLVLHTDADYNGTSMRIDGTGEELAAFILKYLRGVSITFDSLPHLARTMRARIEDETPLLADAIESGMSIKFHLDYVPKEALSPHPYTGDVFAVNDDRIGIELDGMEQSRRTRWFYKHELLHVSMLNRKES